MATTTSYWTPDDFNVFTIEGLEHRMTALQTKIQPKFNELGEEFASQLSSHGKGEFFPHVAKHARRTVNPPKDSWVAFAPAKRGYKALPHFQIGLWNTHLFIILAVIYENQDKKGIAERLQANRNVLNDLPDTYIVSGDHMKPEAQTLKEAGETGIEEVLERLQTVKKAEFLVGRHIPREEAVTYSKEAFLELTRQTINELLPVYDVIVGG